jgi:hypothetical protein
MRRHAHTIGMITAITRHDYFRPEYQDAQVVPWCETHLIDCEWEEDRNCWLCPECSILDAQEDYRQTEPL